MTTNSTNTTIDALSAALTEEEMIAAFLTGPVDPVPVVDVPATGALDVVVRKYRCGDCGYRHVHGVDVTLDDPTVAGYVTGWWVCDECGSDFWNRVRVTAEDHR